MSSNVTNIIISGKSLNVHVTSITLLVKYTTDIQHIIHTISLHTVYTVTTCIKRTISVTMVMIKCHCVK